MAATVASLLMMGVAFHLRGGLTAWLRATTAVDALDASRVALEQLTQDLANAVLVDGRPTAVPPTRFGADTVQCYTLQPARTSAALQWITYALADTSSGPALMRSAQPIEAARQALPASPEPVLTDVEEFSLRYGYTTAQGASSIVWRPAWDEAARLPRLVEVTMTFRRGAAAAPSIRQILVIPTGILPSVE